jgi:hypothetical protein
VRDDLVSQQQAAGNWSDSTVCPEYATAMCCIVLQLSNNCLPIFQR